MRDRIRRLFERLLLPWYSPEEAAAAMDNNERIRRRSIAARIESEQVRRDYAAMGRRLSR
jgi:hypothetical protein